MVVSPLLHELIWPHFFALITRVDNFLSLILLDWLCTMPLSVFLLQNLGYLCRLEVRTNVSAQSFSAFD
jgi:hypothetical protein